MNMRTAMALVTVLTGWSLGTSSTAWACASCGSGGDDPLILYPNERLKGYLGLSQANHFEGINPEGGSTTAGGPSKKLTLGTALGYRFSQRNFATVYVPVIQNSLGSGRHTALGDVSLAGRTTILAQSINELSKPQIQITYGYKHPTGTSLRESKELKTLLDVSGNGFAEIKAGVDIWFGMDRLKPGLAAQFAKPLARSFEGVGYQPGLISRTTLSLGYAWDESWRTTIGINREQKDKLEVGGLLQSDSDQLNHSAFFTTDFKQSAESGIRFSLSRQSALLQNYNTSRYDVMGLAYMHTFM